jgi:hypothetical protein
MNKYNYSIDSLVGETLSFIDIDDDNNEILLTTESERQIKIFHQQDCCESVFIDSTDGDWSELLGKVLIEVTKDVISDETECESSTHTKLIFRVDDATVVSRWVGYSNGYYSENVDIEELTFLKG